MVRPATLALIEDAHRYSAFYRGYLANHLPMALSSLDALGASDARIERFAVTYSTQLEPLQDAERARIRGVRARLEEGGIDGVLASGDAAFASTLGAGAFHGVIRTAFAIECGSSGEVAHALSYWDAATTRMPEGIAQRMADARSSPRFARVLATFPEDLDGMAATVLRAYAATRNFTLLHGVTGCQAARIVLPHFPEPGVAIASLREALAAAYMSCGAPDHHVDAPAADHALDWDEIRRCAAECDDEHDVKLAYSCWREWQRTSDDLYRRAASTRVAHALASS